MIEIFTIGYGGRQADEFIALLKQFEIDMLVDVRSHPYSKYSLEFNRAILSKSLRHVGIDYAFMGDSLGGRPDDRDCYSFSPERNKELLDHQKCETKDFYRQGISALKQALSRRQRLVIMCSELEPHDCHRGYVIGKTLDGEQISVVHIDRHGELKSQAEIPDMLYQPSLL